MSPSVRKQNQRVLSEALPGRDSTLRSEESETVPPYNPLRIIQSAVRHFITPSHLSGGTETFRAHFPNNAKLLQQPLPLLLACFHRSLYPNGHREL